jgi:hypothetical protein
MLGYRVVVLTLWWTLRSPGVLVGKSRTEGRADCASGTRTERYANAHIAQNCAKGHAKCGTECDTERNTNANVALPDLVLAVAHSTFPDAYGTS